MTTAIAEVPQQTTDDRTTISYTPFGETKPIKLSLAIVRSHIAVPTKKGERPSDSELMKFMMLCQARELNPWVGDAYLVGYDSQDGPKFSLITAIQSLYKRAEVNPHYDGLESGVIVIKGDSVIERQGDAIYPGEKLHGGWARCYRKDRKIPDYDSLKLDTFSTGRSQWAKDPAGMIVKCAEASVLRKAFPSQVGSLYIEQERGLLERHVVSETPKPQVKQLSAITDQITGRIIATQGERYARTEDESQAVVDDEPVIETSGGLPEEAAASAVTEHAAAFSSDKPEMNRLYIEGEFATCKTVPSVDNVLLEFLDSASKEDAKWLREVAEATRERLRGAKKKTPAS